MESGNDYIKSGPERIGDPIMRGLAAQQFIFTFLLASANLRRIFRFLRDERRVTPKKIYARGRDIRKESEYVRSHVKPETTDIPPDLWSAADRLKAGLATQSLDWQDFDAQREKATELSVAFSLSGTFANQIEDLRKQPNGGTGGI